MAIKRTKDKKSAGDLDSVGGFGSIPNSKKQNKRPSDIVDMQKIPNDWMEVRFIGKVRGYATHWIKITTKGGKEINIPKPALNFNSKTMTFDSTAKKKDPYMDIPNEKKLQVRYYVNAIIAELKEEEPRKKPTPSKSEKKTGIKDKSTKTWTPVRVIEIPSSLAEKLKKLTNLNRVKDKKTGEVKSYELSHPKFGSSVQLSFDPDAKGTDMYSVQKGDRWPLTDEEKEYLVYNLDDLQEKEDYETAVKEAKALSSKATEKEEEEQEDDEDDDFSPKKKKKKKSSSSDSKDTKKSTKSKLKDKKKSSKKDEVVKKKKKKKL